MKCEWIKVQGILIKGHQVASGIAKHSPYPQGSIEMQTPFFQKLGLDISALFSGTLNVSIRPDKFSVKSPKYTFKQVQWNPTSPPETFSFSPCRLSYEGFTHDSLIYYPHPETKPSHFQDDSTLEILAPPIAKIQYGDRVQLEINPQEIAIFLN
ncbi:hypothetical protein VB715_04285 [Crocosphaera sp. UHCC 0190]|uniref:hypothetical protein n=1 Tax=Crocosphaera sp. UHCC 0190 TaxID=3110246 RepID=UPI002B1FA98D|nr:hypothetical protein [Crocosphaera sp. UHCC 0190]MEA5508975.1 hypothetical protein [Crocosphaera sp. UHCC 0190]